jgi:hypothetical protein
MTGRRVIKQFTVIEGSVAGGWYRIEVFWRGQRLEAFLKPTMAEAEQAFAAAGYEPWPDRRQR